MKIPSKHKFYLILIISLVLNTAIKASLNDSLFTFPQPVLWYNFEATGDSIYDQSGNNINGNATSDAVQDNGIILFSDLNSSYLQIADDELLNNLNQFTMAFRVAIHDLGTDLNRIFAQKSLSNDYAILYSTNFRQLEIWDSGRIQDHFKIEIQDTLFHEIIVVYNDSVCSAYYDNAFYGTVKPESFHPQLFWLKYLGINLHGAMDEFKMYPYALDSNQIKSIFSPDELAPSTPENLSGIMLTPTSILLSWDAALDDHGTSGYILFRDGNPIDTTATLSYIDFSLQSNSTYTYQVQAGDYYGNFSDISSGIAVRVCDSINAMVQTDEYVVCKGDTVTLETDIINIGYTYQWQVGSGLTYSNLNTNSYYLNTNGEELTINGVKAESLPSSYRLMIENACAQQDSVYITISETELFSLSGSVITGNKPLDSGVVYLYNAEWFNGPDIASSYTRNGDYFFSNICPGNYILKAKPLGQTADIYADRYYSQTLNNTPTELPIYSDFTHVLISLLPWVLDVSTYTDHSIHLELSVNNELILTNQNGSYYDYHVRIISSQGQLLTTHKFKGNQERQIINIGYLPSGIYYAIVESENRLITTFKFSCLLN